MERTEVTRRIWAYIKQRNLQDPSNLRIIKADDGLRPIFGKESVSMFEMTTLLSAHLNEAND